MSCHFSYALSLVFLISLPANGQMNIRSAVELEIPTDTGKFYQVRSSTDLETWLDSGSLITGTGASAYILQSTRGESTRFFDTQVFDSVECMTIDVTSHLNPCGRSEFRITENGTGNTWTWSLKHLGTGTENNEPVYIMQEYDENGNPNDQSFVQTDLSTDAFETGILNDYGQPSETKAFWQPAVPLLMKSFVLGRQYTSEHSRADLPFATLTHKLTSVLETVTVPYGTFDCIKVTKTFEVDGSVVHVDTRWYAKHVGMVKRLEADSDEVWELLSYQP